jgi:CheY-like chemotaxis protein
MTTNRICDILLIEDDADDAEQFRWAVGQARSGCDLCVVSDGKAAADHLMEKAGPTSWSPLPTLIITDLRMPGQSGLDFLAWKRSRPELSKIPVVVLSGEASPDDLDRSYALGARSCLVKPASLHELAHLVQGLLNFWIGFNQCSY